MNDRFRNIQKKIALYKFQWMESYFRLRMFSRVALPDSGERSVSVAIPFYNNADMGHLSLLNLIDDQRVSEIVILDDCSNAEEFEKMKKKVAPFHKKIRFYTRSENLGPFSNKIQVVGLCKSDWVILLDYDNTLTEEYLDAMFSIEDWKEDTIYCSDWAFPNFSFKELSGHTITFDSACEMAKNNSLNGPFFNDGNYLVNRRKYVGLLDAYRKYRVAASDVIFANYIWLSAGGKLSVVGDSMYVHRVHEGSTWLKTSKESQRVSQLIKNAFRTSAKHTDGWMDRELTQNPIISSGPTLVPLT